MIVGRSLMIKYLCMSASDTGVYAYHVHDTLNYCYKKTAQNVDSRHPLQRAERLCNTGGSQPRAICNTIINNSLESSNIFSSLKLTIFALIFSEILLPHHFMYAFIYYLIPLVTRLRLLRPTATR